MPSVSASRRLRSPLLDDHFPSCFQAGCWNAAANPGLRQAAERQDARALATAWRNHFLRMPRRGEKSPRGLCLWSLFDADAQDPIVKAARAVFAGHQTVSHSGTRPAMKSGRRSELHLAELVSLLALQAGPWSPVETLIAAELLATFVKQLSADQIWPLLTRLAIEAGQKDSSPKNTSQNSELPDQFLLRVGELPFLVGCLLEPWREARKLREFGRRTLVKELIARTDSDGTPHAELLPRMPLWLAPLIRATLWAEQFQNPVWSDDERNRLSLLLERAIPLCRPGGHLAMSNGLAIPALPLFDVAAKAVSLSGPAETLLRTLRTAGTTVKKKRPRGGVESMPSHQSDWARFAMLRTDWTSHADSLAISHHRPFPQLDVAVLGRPILHGPWSFELQIGETVFEPAPEWSCTCWCSDPDADYLELQMRGPGRMCIERQVLLSRKDHFLMLADCLHGVGSATGTARSVPNEQRINLRTRLGLAADVTATAARPTREIVLKAGTLPVRVFPLALPDDRVQSTPHDCRVEGQELVLHQVGTGQGMYAPIVFDWHPARVRKPALWRALTVAEGGRALGRDLATGYRLQVDKYQLLIYRSLSKINTARTVLGHHTWQESVIGQFDAKGDVDILMKVDP